jgi:hypothetical protein
MRMERPSRTIESLAGSSFVPQWRFLISQAHSLVFSVPDEMSKVIENDYVRARQENPAVTQDTLHLWLTLGRSAFAASNKFHVEVILTMIIEFNRLDY